MTLFAFRGVKSHGWTFYDHIKKQNSPVFSVKIGSVSMLSIPIQDPRTNVQDQGYLNLLPLNSDLLKYFIKPETCLLIEEVRSEIILNSSESI